MNKILVVDDDRMARFAITENLKDGGFYPVEASNGLEAIEMFQREKPASVLLDLKMPGINGLDTLKELKKIDADVPVIINTAHGDIQTAVKAIKLGAYDFVVKPPDYDRLNLILMRSSEQYTLNKKVKMLNSDLELSLEYILGRSQAMKKVIQQIHQIAHSDFSLVLQGETGTGKSFIARTVHNLSRRANGPFVSIDIGAMPETLIESELFGYVKGAFTGADRNKKGFFETASGGTILIDELQNMSPYVQSKLLAAVEEKHITPVGSTRSVKTDIRIIGATNTDIITSVREKKTFREDLFYRISEVIIMLPPLRERTGDIPFLAEKFFREASEDLDKPLHAISQDAFSLLKNYSWPGNIRELKNVIRRAVLFAKEETVKPEHIEFLIKDAKKSMKHDDLLSPDDVPLASLADVEKTAIKKTLDITKGNKSKAALILKIDYTTLLRKIRHYGI